MRSNRMARNVNFTFIFITSMFKDVARNKEKINKFLEVKNHRNNECSKNMGFLFGSPSFFHKNLKQK